MTEEQMEALAKRAGFTPFALADPHTKARVWNVIRMAEKVPHGFVLVPRDLLLEAEQFIEQRGEAWFKKGKSLTDRMKEILEKFK